MYKLYGSFSQNPGSFGYNFFNKQFQYNKIEAIYQPFKINNIQEALDIMKIINILGVGVSQPYKVAATHFVKCDNEVDEIGALNTIVNNGELVGHNTDWKSIYDHVLNIDKPTYILGNGGYAKAAFYACRKLNRQYININRDNWHTISSIYDSLIINCTPVESIVENNNVVLYANINTKTGQSLALRQACYQYQIYTGKWPDVSIY